MASQGLYRNFRENKVVRLLVHTNFAHPAGGSLHTDYTGLTRRYHHGSLVV